MRGDGSRASLMALAISNAGQKERLNDSGLGLPGQEFEL
jgi:hypothetical protein